VQKQIQIGIINKNLGTNKIKQRKKLLQIILQRRTRNQQPPPTRKRPNNLTQNGVHVFDAMGFVDDDVFKGKLFEGGAFDEADFV
jgi:hypothetical protein